ncbi:MAG: peptide deformylase [Chloroflexi bacterium]|nr:peptide deformylase [Chloroflexota bacterium]
MAVLPLRHLPDPVLRQKAKRIRTIDAALQRLIDDMIETMHAENGVGLAANQVGVLRRVVVIQLPDDEQATVLINPEIIRREGEVEVHEGCLSIPGYRGDLKRAVTVRVKALDRTGKSFRIRGQELLAEALEHETDHLDGILYIDHITDPESFYKMDSLEASEGDRQANTASG